MQIDKLTVWVIMSKDRKWIAKGIPRSRYLIKVDDKKDSKRILTYSSKRKAEAGFKLNSFYGAHRFDEKEHLEAVRCELTLNEIIANE